MDGRSPVSKRGSGVKLFVDNGWKFMNTTKSSITGLALFVWCGLLAAVFGQGTEEQLERHMFTVSIPSDLPLFESNDYSLPARLPADLTAEWVSAGAISAWTHIDQFGSQEFTPVPRKGDLQTFELRDFGPLDDLPVPNAAFGLRIGPATNGDQMKLLLKRLNTAEAVDLSGPRIQDQFIKNSMDFFVEHLHLLPRIRVLSLRGSSISDEGAKHFEKLSTLEHLDLSGPEISGTGLKHLAGLKSLQFSSTANPGYF
jgi:hypothetical protein